MIRYSDFLSRLKNSHDYGNYISGVCPFHADTSPSLLVYKDGWFRCLGCNRNGNWTTLWNKLQGQSVIVRQETNTHWALPSTPPDMDMEELCYQANADLMSFESYQWYIKMRGLEGRIATQGLGYWRGWYTIPVYDETGKFETVVFRAAPHVALATNIKYYCKHKPTMYAPSWSRLNKAKTIAVVYGMFDALTLADMNVPVVTATSGKAEFQAGWLNNYRVPVRIFPDLGEEKDAMKLARDLGWRGGVIALPYPEGIKDPNGYLEKGRKKELLLRLVNTFPEATDA